MAPKKVVTGIDLSQNPDIARFMGGFPLDSGTNTPPATPPLPEEPAKAPPPVVETPREESPTPTPDPSELSSRERYLKDLDRVGVSQEKAAEVIQSMIFQGAYTETVPVTRQLSVSFRTRDNRATERLNEVINKENPQFTAVLHSLIATYNLASSLVQYGPLKFDPSTDEGFTKSLNYIRTKIPQPVYQLLVTKLSKFDEKLATIMQDGCVEDFF